MGKAGDRWREFIAKVKLMQVEGAKKLLLVGLYVFILLLIVIDLVCSITVACVVVCLILSLIVIFGLLIYKMY